MEWQQYIPKSATQTENWINMKSEVGMVSSTMDLRPAQEAKLVRNIKAHYRRCATWGLSQEHLRPEKTEPGHLGDGDRVSQSVLGLVPYASRRLDSSRARKSEVEAMAACAKESSAQASYPII